MILEEISGMIINKKRKNLFRRHARNLYKTSLEKNRYKSAEILNSIFATGSVNDIKLMCGMSDRDIVRKSLEYRDGCKFIGPHYIDYYQMMAERAEIRKIHDKMNLFLETRCPASKKPRFRGAKKRGSTV